MKLLLTSAGFTTEGIVAEAERLVGKPRAEISVAVINEGYAVEHGANLWWVLLDMNSVNDNFGGPSELVSLLALPIETIVERISQHDMIYVVGGHTDYLMKVFNDGGLSDQLPKLLESMVYVGSSAGAMIMARRNSSAAYQQIYDETGDYGIDGYLEHVNFAIKPHMGSDNFPRNTPANLEQACRGFDGTVYGLTDESAIAIDGEQICMVGPQPYAIVNGKPID